MILPKPSFPPAMMLRTYRPPPLPGAHPATAHLMMVISAAVKRPMSAIGSDLLPQMDFEDGSPFTTSSPSQPVIEREGRYLWGSWTRTNSIPSSIPPSQGTTASVLGQSTRTRYASNLLVINVSNPRSKNSTTRSSPSTSHASSSLPSPPATRQRARKVSATQSLKNGKGKQVDFGQVEVVDVASRDDSDLTDLTELDEQTQASPSPRRLRSKGDKPQRKPGIDSARKAAFAQKLKSRAPEPAQEDLPAVSDEEEDEDQLMSTGPSRTARGRRTPVKSRLRPRPAQTHTPPSDGDDEEEEEEESVQDDLQEGDAEDDRADLSDDDTAAIPTKPRTLRNGKVVSASEESLENEEAEDDEISVDEDEAASVQSESTSDVEGEEDSDMEGEASEESMDECELCSFLSPRGERPD